MFSVGDKVKYELDRWNHLPRVDYGHDYGSTGKREEGLVVVQNEGKFIVRLKGGELWTFLSKNKDMAGFPVLVEGAKETTETTRHDKKNASKLDAWLSG